MNLSLDEIADRIIDVILDERILSKESLKLRIRPILKIWLKCTDSPKITTNDILPKHIKTLEIRQITIDFWKTEFKKKATHEEFVNVSEKISKIQNEFEKTYIYEKSKS